MVMHGIELLGLYGSMLDHAYEPVSCSALTAILHCAVFELFQHAYVAFAPRKLLQRDQQLEPLMSHEQDDLQALSNL